MSQQLNLNDLHSIINHLLEERLDTLHLLLSGPVQERALRAMLQRLEAYQPAPRSRMPLAAELTAADRLHDALGNAISSFGQACQLHPTLDPALRAEVQRLVEGVLPTRLLLRASYVDEAHAARQRQPFIDAERENLRRIPTPGGTLEDWVDAFQAAGLRLEQLLKERAAQRHVETTPREDLSPLLAQARRLLDRLRATVQDELEHRPELPRDVERRLFAFQDLILEARKPS